MMSMQQAFSHVFQVSCTTSTQSK